MRLLVTAPGNRLTGVARYAAALAAGWQRFGHDVTVAVHGPSEASDEFAAHACLRGRVHDVRLPTLRRSASAAARHAIGLWSGTGALLELLDRTRPDVVVGHCIFNVWSAWAASARRVPFVPVLHELPFSYPASAYFAWQSVILANAHHVVAVSEPVARTLPAGSTACTVVPPGVDTAVFRADVDGADLRQRWLGGHAGPLFVCVSHLMPPKGQLDAVHAMAEVVRELPGARLIFVGGTNGIPAQQRFLAQLQHAASARSLSAHIEFVGPIHRCEQALAAADVVVVPSRGESFGLVPLEACAVGRWVAATDVGVVPALVTRGAPIIAVPPERPHDLAQALIAASRRTRPAGFTEKEWTVDGAVSSFERVFERLPRV